MDKTVDRLGAVSETSDDEVEAAMPQWAVDVNRREKGIAMRSLLSALSTTR